MDRVLGPITVQRESRKPRVKTAGAGPLTEEEREYYERRIGVLLGNGNFHAARLTIDEAEELARLVVPLTLDTPLGETDLGKESVRIINSLETCGILTVRDLISKTKAELLSLRRFGLSRVDICLKYAREWADELHQ